MIYGCLENHDVDVHRDFWEEAAVVTWALGFLSLTFFDFCDGEQVQRIAAQVARTKIHVPKNLVQERICGVQNCPGFTHLPVVKLDA